MFIPEAEKSMLWIFTNFDKHLVFDEHLESIFCLFLVVEVFSLQKVFERLEEVVVSGIRLDESGI